MKYVIITGCAGFIGSHFLEYFLKVNKKFKVIGIDKMGYASNKHFIKKLKKNKKFIFFKKDISNFNELKKIFESYDVQHVVNLAAETHVDNSINNPDMFIKSNIVGTFNLLKASLNKWRKSNQIYKNKFLQVSTDEVFGSVIKGKFKETDKYLPNSPYSSSKASADLIVRSFHKTYKLNTIITHSANNFGPRQHKEKFIPTIINSLKNKKKIPVYGKGLNVRNWLYVNENSKALYKILFKGKSGESYNIGSEVEYTNIDLVKKICKIYKNIKKNNFNYNNLISFVKDRPGHDLRYSLDIKKISKLCKWKPSNNFDRQLRSTILFYDK